MTRTSWMIAAIALAGMTVVALLPAIAGGLPWNFRAGANSSLVRPFTSGVKARLEVDPVRGSFWAPAGSPAVRAPLDLRQRRWAPGLKVAGG